MPFTPESAAEIERSSWDVTQKLVEPEEDDISSEPSLITEDTFEKPEPESDDGSLTPQLTGTLAGALAAAMSGDFDGYCRENALFPDDIAGRINEYFSDVLGDIVLEQSGGGYTVINDYRRDIEDWLKNA